jgi:hypothetical protein
MKFSRKGRLGHPNLCFSFKMPRKVHLENQVTHFHVFNFQQLFE